MCDDSDHEISELDIETRNWSKLEKDMKLIGFREGAAKGRDISLQQGFNLGYLDGFKLGEYLGMVKGMISCQKALEIKDLKLDDNDLKVLSSEACVLCPKGKKYKTPLSEEIYSEKLEHIIEKQQSCSKEIIASLENSGFKIYNEKG